FRLRGGRQGPLFSVPEASRMPEGIGEQMLRRVVTRLMRGVSKIAAPKIIRFGTKKNAAETKNYRYLTTLCIWGYFVMRCEKRRHGAVDQG
ncbi:MAG: hypothetical protein IKY83_02135, partial [Proteobacteria bacterium]|nr:hypothetical protein [Pseudomonadota bacterium]